MNPFVIQFHALPAETLAFAQSMVTELGMSLFAIVPKPFRIEELSPCEAATVDRRSGAGSATTTLWLSIDGSIPSTDTFDEFLLAAPAGFLFDLGEETPDGLHESAVSLLFAPPGSEPLVRKFKARFRAATHSGVQARNPATGDEGRAHGHRYTTGAKDLYLNGVAWLPIAGTVQLFPILAEEGGPKTN